FRRLRKCQKSMRLRRCSSCGRMAHKGFRNGRRIAGKLTEVIHAPTGACPIAASQPAVRESASPAAGGGWPFAGQRYFGAALAKSLSDRTLMTDLAEIMVCEDVGLVELIFASDVPRPDRMPLSTFYSDQTRPSFLNAHEDRPTALPARPAQPARKGYGLKGDLRWRGRARRLPTGREGLAPSRRAIWIAKSGPRATMPIAALEDPQVRRDFMDW